MQLARRLPFLVAPPWAIQAWIQWNPMHRQQGLYNYRFVVAKCTPHQVIIECIIHTARRRPMQQHAQIAGSRKPPPGAAAAVTLATFISWAHCCTTWLACRLMCRPGVVTKCSRCHSLHASSESRCASCRLAQSSALHTACSEQQSNTTGQVNGQSHCSVN